MKPTFFSNVCMDARIKTIGVVFLVLALSILSNAQSSNPVKWTFEAKKMSSDIYELQLIARISAGWRIYSQFGGNDTGLPTSIQFTSNPQITIEGLAKEEGKMYKSPLKVGLFDAGMTYFTQKVIFKQTVRLKTGTSSTIVTGGIRYTPVNGKNRLTLKTVTFSIPVGK